MVYLLITAKCLKLYRKYEKERIEELRDLERIMTQI